MNDVIRILKGCRFEMIQIDKDEISKDLHLCTTFEEVKSLVDDWFDYYNKDRYQWDLQMLSPNEYYKYRTTGVYPINRGTPLGQKTEDLGSENKL